MATWCESLTDQRRFYFPRDIESLKAMRLVNIITALLDETACEASVLAAEIFDDIRASIPRIGQGGIKSSLRRNSMNLSGDSCTVDRRLGYYPETSRLDQEIGRLQKAIISSSNQIKRNLQLYTLGEVD